MKSSAYYPFFRKLANPLRISIITSLAKKEETVSQLSREIGVEQSKLSHALHELSGCSIVKARKEGKKRIYSVSRTILPILNLINVHSQKCCKYCAYGGKK
ncbi:MAG: metalloregulator ArsR/SmtB family transcription factor [archaeon]